MRPDNLNSGTLYGQYQLRGSILTIKDSMDAVSGYMAFGTDMTTIPTGASAGTGIYIDYTGIYGLASNVQQAYMRASDGKIVAGAGVVTLDVDGITIIDPGAKNDENTIKWVNSGTSLAKIVSYLSGTTVTSELDFIGGSNSSAATIHSRGGTAKDGTLTLATDSNASNFGTYTSVLTLTSTTSRAYARFYNTQTTDYGVLISNANPSITAPSSLLHLYSTAPTFRMEDSTASAKSLLVTTDANLTKFEEAGGAANNLLVLDLANARVGIGTASPYHPFHIVSAASTDSSLKFNQVIQTTTAYDANPTGGIQFWNKYKSDGTVAGMGGISVGKENSTDANLASFLSLHTRPAGGEITERLRISSDGGLGILDGISAPATKSGWAYLYVDSADGDLKVKFGDGTVKTIVTDT